ncbi:hypothetical protein LBK6_10820 [Leptospira borgpetersenii serovar Hardjo]|nr:hypothetical protein LBK6_10820 [Leptospira borgpetersenii serovar Hardjo]AWV70601.1 hypothetical protein B9T54_11700 [Leptospira borgpetersenii serovar Hardjo-bovis]TQE54084.1 hypothetical protein FFZ95_05380 [Leptospira borgpetersenii]AMX62060.1 hypothetical protein LBK9_10860 [Leptospira borgpetersenii serovar Hardjo]AMX65303.1 hypothetical protein LBK30_10880 [Leptospira borgpetersenii serovar Hardjo]
MFLYDVGTVINDLPWWGKGDTSLTVYRGPHIRKKISNVKEVWTIRQPPLITSFVLRIQTIGP